jgi:hypothetical protein
VPGDRDLPGAHRGSPSTLISDADQAVGFLDAPTLELEELVAAVGEAFGVLAIQAVLTVYSSVVPSDAFAAQCGGRGIDLLAAIDHEDGGTTFTLRRAPSDPG